MQYCFHTGDGGVLKQYALKEQKHATIDQAPCMPRLSHQRILTGKSNIICLDKKGMGIQINTNNFT